MVFIAAGTEHVLDDVAILERVVDAVALSTSPKHVEKYWQTYV